MNKFCCHTYALILLIMILSACTDTENNIKYAGKITETNLSGHNIDLNGIFEPHRMTIIDTFLFISCLNGDYFFHILNLKTLKPIQNFGLKGRGPNEFLSPRLFNGQRIINDNGANKVLIYDEGKNIISKIDIQKILTKDKNAITSEVVPTNMDFVSDIIFTNDSIAIYLPWGEKNNGRFSIYNYSLRKKYFTSYLPDLGFKVHSNNLYPIYNTGSASVNEGINKFVAIPVLMCELDFFDLTGNYLGSTIIERVKELEYAKNEAMIFTAPNIRYYISDIQSTPDIIYVLLTTKLYPDLRNNGFSEIFVFDWNGNPIEKFILDREISTFCYDTEYKRFIGYSVNDLEGSFVEYKLDLKK